MNIIALNRHWVIYWRWLLLTVITFIFLVGLAFWQLERAHYKTQILKRLAHYQQAGTLSAQQLKILAPELADGVQLSASAHWLAPYVWLLDNQMLKGRIGYDVVVPMQLDASDDIIVVNLGWVAAPLERKQLPEINVPMHLIIQGIVRTHVGGIRLGKNIEDTLHWPMRIQKVDINELHVLLKKPVYAGVVYQLQNSPYLVHYQSVVVSPDRHRAYALQWFLLAIAVVFVALAASLKKDGENKNNIHEQESINANS